MMKIGDADQQTLNTCMLAVMHELTERISVLTLTSRVLVLSCPEADRNDMHANIRRALVTTTGLSPERAKMLDEIFGDESPRMAVIEGGKTEG